MKNGTKPEPRRSLPLVRCAIYTRQSTEEGLEREIIAGRTRDRLAATRRKGKWTGGCPILGYDVDRRGFKLTVNESEAERVRAIFALYLGHEALLPVVQELERRGWVNKRWQ